MGIPRYQKVFLTRTDLFLLFTHTDLLLYFTYADLSFFFTHTDPLLFLITLQIFIFLVEHILFTSLRPSQFFSLNLPGDQSVNFHDAVELSRTSAFGFEVQRRILLGMFCLSQRYHYPPSILYIVGIQFPLAWIEVQSILIFNFFSLSLTMQVL